MAAPAQLPIFEIEGLFGRYNVRLPLYFRPLILVGQNGTGKSTTLSILNLFISGQWRELGKLPFSRIHYVTPKLDVTATIEDISDLGRIEAFLIKDRLWRRRTTDGLPASFKEAQVFIRRVFPRYGEIDERKIGERYENLARLFRIVHGQLRPTILYYPTYRRIEREVEDILDTAPPEEWEEGLTAGIKRRYQEYGEVIGFGGQDIADIIGDATSAIENSARQTLNEHSVKFLDVLYQQGDLSSGEFRKSILKKDNVDRLIERINTLAPNTIDVNRLRESIGYVQSKLTKGKSGRLSAREDVIVVYMARLLEVFEEIDQLTRPLQQYAAMVSSYTEPLKTAVFDEGHFTISYRDKEGSDVTPEQFSSGEKQIVALFAFLLFSKQPRGNVLIIDEPELSLSVVWQRRLLNDLLSTRRPEILVAATHSPFIFEKMDLDNVVSMEELLVAQ